MRFHYGSIPDSPGFIPEAQGWHSVHEVGPGLLQILALVVAIIMMTGDLVLLRLLWPGFSLEGVLSAFSLIGLLAVLLAFIPLHELIHAMFHPGGGLTSDSVLGLWLSRGMLYAHYDGPMPRNRFLTIIAAPGLLLAAVPALMLAGLSQLGTPVVALERLAYLSVIGAVLGCGDVVGIVMVLLQIPSSATVRNKSWRTYWKQGSRG